jgi:hypothetical protein
MSENYNIRRVSSASLIGGQQPQNGSGELAKTRAGEKATPLTDATMTTRQIPGLTRYDADLGIAVPVDEAQEETATEQTETETANRHEVWKKQQAAKKEQIAAQTNKKAAEQQVLAKDLLIKGDLMGAAKLLGLSGPELALYVNNAQLAIPNEVAKPKILTEAEQLKADNEKLKADVEAIRNERQSERNFAMMSSYIDQKIMPELSIKDKYEMLSMFDAKELAKDVYQQLNQHYTETKEELKVEDFLQAIEDELTAASVASLEKTSKLKKMSKYFHASEVQDSPQGDQFSSVKLTVPVTDKTKRTLTLAEQNDLLSREDEGDAIGQDRPMTSVNPKLVQSNRTLRNLSPAEKLAAIRQEEAEERRKRK